MDHEPTTTVAVLSSRPTLDLAINTWFPGFEARSRPDLDEVIELAGAEGIIVIDLASTGQEQMLQALVERGASVPIVAVLAPGEDGSELVGDPIVVAAPSGVEVLAAALARARERLDTRDAEPADSTLIDLTALEEGVVDRCDEGVTPVPAKRGNSGLSRMLTRLRSRSSHTTGGAAPVSRIIDLTAEPELPALEGQLRPGPQPSIGADGLTIDELAGAMVPTIGVLRGWALLDELTSELGTASAVVTQRTTAGHHVVVAGVDVAACDAEQMVRSGDWLLRAISDGPGWLVRDASTASAMRGVPLGECEELLVAAIAGAGTASAATAPGGLLVAGHFRAFSPTTASAVAAAAADPARLDQRLRLRWAPTVPVDLAALEPDLACVPAVTVRSSWRLLAALGPALSGPAVVAIRDHQGRYVVTAAQFVDPHHALRVLEPGHPLLARVKEQAGPVLVAEVVQSAELLRSVPLPSASHVAALPVGAADAPAALVLLARDRPITAEDAAALSAIITAHGTGAEAPGASTDGAAPVGD